MTQRTKTHCQDYEAGNRVKFSLCASKICALDGFARLPLNQWHLGNFLKYILKYVRSKYF